VTRALRSARVLYLFDIDGTLLHAHGSGRAAFDAVFAERHGLTDASAGIRYGGKTDPGIVDEIFRARLGRRPTPDETAAFLDAYIPRLRAKLLSDGVQVIAGVAAALAELARREGVMGIATGNIRAGADAKLAAAKLGIDFELGGYGCDSHVRAELVARAIERGRARGPVREVVVVGDTIHDIAAARACNATVCAVATGTDPAERLGDADVVFASLSELPDWHAGRFD
jgi:phosphoglycolate phosphatase